MAKNLILDLIIHFGSIFTLQKLFFKNLASSVIKCHGQLSSCYDPITSYDPILRKCNDGWTDRQTDRQTDNSDFIRSCRTSNMFKLLRFSRQYSTFLNDFRFTVPIPAEQYKQLKISRILKLKQLAMFASIQKWAEQGVI